MLGFYAVSGTYTVCSYWSLHAPAGACIPVASGPPNHVFPI